MKGQKRGIFSKLIVMVCVAFVISAAGIYGAYAADDAAVSTYGEMNVTDSNMTGAKTIKKKNGVQKAANGYYYYYRSGKAVRKTGWVKVDKTLSVKLTSAYRVQYKQIRKGSRTYISTYSRSRKKFILLDRTQIVLSDKKLHYVGRGGVLANKKANVRDARKNLYILGSGGVVVKKYIGSTGKLYKNVGGRLKAVTNDTATVSGDALYFFGKNSTKVTDKGWYTMYSKDKVCVSAGGKVTHKYLTKSRKLYKYNYSKKKWELQKNTSIKIGGKTYYFDKSGKQTAAPAPATTEAPTVTTIPGDPGPVSNILTNNDGRGYSCITNDNGISTYFDNYGYVYESDGSYAGYDGFNNPDF